MYLNTVTIIGNLTRDPEIKSLPSGVSVASFSVATNHTYKDKDGQKKDTVEYHNVVCFGKYAELIGQYMRKGSQLLVQGRLQTRSWEKDGQKHYRTEIVAEKTVFGNKPRETSQNPYDALNSSPRAPQEATGGDVMEYPAEEISPEYIPF